MKIGPESLLEKIKHAKSVYVQVTGNNYTMSTKVAKKQIRQDIEHIKATTPIHTPPIFNIEFFYETMELHILA